MGDSLEEIVKKYERNVIGLVSAADELEDELLRLGLLQVNIRIRPNLLAFDCCNRQGTGGQPMEIHLLMEDIAFVGFSWRACAHAICCAVAPGSTEIEDFNIPLFSDETLPTIVPGQILYGTLACGHTNAGLRCIDAGTITATSLIATDGRFDLGRLKSRNAKFAEACIGKSFHTRCGVTPIGRRS